MPTIREVINRVKLPGNVSEEFKYRWLSQLDNVTYRYPDDADTELAIQPPYDNVYDIYFKAMNDFFTGDLRAYEESSREFCIAQGKRGVIDGFYR